MFGSVKVAINFYSNKREPLAPVPYPAASAEPLAIARLAILRLLPCLEHVLTKTYPLLLRICYNYMNSKLPIAIAQFHEGHTLLALKRGRFTRPAGGRIGPLRHTVLMGV